MNFERGRTVGGGRWYPTLLTLADGRIFAMSGHPDRADTRHNNYMIETFDPAQGSWIDEGDQFFAPMSYPRLHLLPDEQVFCVRLNDGDSKKWDPKTNKWTFVAKAPSEKYLDMNGNPAEIYDGIHYSSVLLPVTPDDGYKARVLVVGVQDPKVIDLGAASPSWQSTMPRTLYGRPRRIYANAVLLPDGKVLVLGGSKSNLDKDAVYEAEQYDPVTGEWSTLARASYARVYHSVALLLPDGRVWVAGSNTDSAQGLGNFRKEMEVYLPPYLFQGPRPTINNAPLALNLSNMTSFNVDTHQALSIQSAALIRCGSVTHAFNSDQRYVGLAIKNRTTTTVTVDSPPNNNIAPPGYYLLFVLDNYGVPSIGRFIQVL